MNPEEQENTQPSFLTQIVLAVSAAEQEVAAELTSLPENPSANELALYQADITHRALLRLGHKATITSAARRWQLYQTFSYEKWRNVRIPSTEPGGKVIEGEYITFSTFDEYFDYITSASSPDCWNITAPSSLSILKSGATILLPAAGAELIISPSNGHVYTVEEVLSLDEHVQQLLIGVANRALNPQKGAEAKPIQTIGQAADIIGASEGYEDASLKLKEAGLVGGAIPGQDKFTVFTYNTGEEVYIAARLTLTQYRLFLMALKSKADPASTSLEALSGLFNTPEESEIDDDEPDDMAETFSAYLEGNSK